MSTKMQAFCTLRTPFDISSNALFNHGYHPIQPLQNVRFINMVITRATNGSPDMICMAFDGKFKEKKDEIPPEACRPLQKLKKNNVQQVDPHNSEKKQCRKSAPPTCEQKTRSKKWTLNKLTHISNLY